MREDIQKTKVIKIKKLAKKDIKDCLKIILETRASTNIIEATWLMRRSIKKTSPIKSEYWVLTLGRKVVGVSGLYSDYEDPKSVKWLDYLAVTPKLQRRGYGTMMLKNLEKICRRRKIRLLCVYTDNKKALYFYLKNKFSMLGKINNYYEHNTPRIWLYKKLA